MVGEDGYRTLPFVLDDSDLIRRKKAGKRNRRLEPGDEEKLLAAANPPLQRLIIAALETCCRNDELLSLQWRDVSLGRREIMLRAAKTKTSTDRVIPISDHLQAVLELVRHDPTGQPFRPLAYVFGDELGRRVKSAKRAWQTAVLKAQGHAPVWIWKKNRQESGGSGRLDRQSQAAYRTIDLHFHDLRHEAGSRLLEAGWDASLDCEPSNARARVQHRSSPSPRIIEAVPGIPCKFLQATLLAPR